MKEGEEGMNEGEWEEGAPQEGEEEIKQGWWDTVERELSSWQEQVHAAREEMVSQCFTPAEPMKQTAQAPKKAQKAGR